MRRSLPVLIALSLAILVIGCSKARKEEAKAPEQTPPVNLRAPDSATGIRPVDFTWGREVGLYSTFFYQPGDSLTKWASLLKDKVEEIYQTAALMLGLENLEPIEFYCFKDFANLERYTGRSNAFYIGNKFYYAYGPALGEPVARYVMEKLPRGQTRFTFMRDGVPLLLDFSGRNFHDLANNYRAQNIQSSVRALTDNEEFARLNSTQALFEAASLCGYLMYEYEWPKFRDLFHSDGTFPEALKKVIGIDIDQLEKGWGQFLPEHTDAKELERSRTKGGGQS